MELRQGAGVELDGPLINFGEFKAHLSVYLMTTTIQKQFKNTLPPYLSGKGTAKFLFDQPIPTS